MRTKSIAPLKLLAYLCVWWPLSANAHPMDFAKLEVQVVWNELQTEFTLHKLAASQIVYGENLKGTEVLPSPAWNHQHDELLFQKSFANTQPRLMGSPCEWKSHIATDSRSGPDFLVLKMVAQCAEPTAKDFSFQLNLPFLEKMPKSFEVAGNINYMSLSLNQIINANRTALQFDVADNQSFSGFFQMGMAHIGALPSEWRNQSGMKLPEGIDHILFVVSLILLGDTLLGLLKCVSGFTLGHSVTLGLSVLKIIHVHSRWIEALIALSIAFIAGSALLDRNKSHSWIIAALFGTVHGLGFASAMQELELSPSTVLPALFGFNLGVEAGQMVIIAMILPTLFLCRFFLKPIWYTQLHKSFSLALLLVGSFWFIQRAIN